LLGRLIDKAVTHTLFCAASLLRKKSVCHPFGGQRTDAYARDAIRGWVESENLADDVVLINRRLYEPGEGLAYRIPDIRVPDANLILDGTIGWKWGTTAQIGDFRAFSGARIIVVRPSALGGPYTPLARDH
jgi:hypothetical protein